jgi:hypothetical protein
VSSSLVCPVRCKCVVDVFYRQILASSTGLVLS